MLSYLWLFAASALASFLLALPIRAMALRLGMVDHPERRKMHQIPIPLMGGLAVALSFGLVSFLALRGLGALDEVTLRSCFGLAGGAVIILLFGLYDDARGIKPAIKFLGQVLAALVVVAMGARIDFFTNPLGEAFHLGWLAVPLTVFWIVGVTNAVNLIDGLDGLAVGVGGIAALGLFAISSTNNPFVATLTIVLAGASLGFLPHNFYPAKMFLGDTGSMFIGFILSVIGLQGSLKATTATILSLPMIVLGIPILDTLFAIFRRARRRVSPFKADREHIHHRLVRIGLHHRKVVLVLYFVCIYLAVTAYSIAQLPYKTAMLFLVLLTMAGIIGLRALQFIEERLEARLNERGPAADRADTGPAPALASNGRRSAGELRTMVCAFGGVREGFGRPAELESMCADIQSMLSRRIRVHSVTIEPAGPRDLLILLRTEPLKPAMQALVRDGVAWYLEDHRESLAGDAGFPDVRWFPLEGAVPETAGGAVRARVVKGAPEPREGPVTVPLGEGRTRMAGS